MPMSRVLFVVLMAVYWGAAGPFVARAAEVDCGPIYSCAQLVYLGLTYPYDRPSGSYLFIDGTIYPYIHATDHLLQDSIVSLPDRTAISVGELLAKLGLADHVGKSLTPVFGYGSNPSPEQLARKYSRGRFHGTAVIPVMKGAIADYDVVWTPVFVGYGSMPSTITPSPGTEVDVWITWLGPEELARMNDSEGTGRLYAYASLDGAQYRFDGPAPQGVRLYVSCFGALTIDEKTLAVAAVPARRRQFRAVDSPEAVEATFPWVGWTGSVLDFLYSNVTDPKALAERNAKIRRLGVLADHSKGDGQDACGADGTGNGGKF